MKRTFINISSGAIGFILPMGLNLIFTPLIIKNLGSDAYGLQSLVNVIIGFLMVADMGLDIPVTRFVAEYKAQNDNVSLNKLLNTSLQMYLLIGAFGALIIGFLSPVLIDHVFKLPAHFRQQGLYVFYLAAIGFIGGLLNMWGKSLFNGLLRYDVSNAIDVITTLLSLLIGTFLVVKGYGVVTYVFVRVACTLISGLAYLLIGKSFFLPGFKISLGVDKKIWNSLKTQVGYGFFLRVAGILTSRLDQTLIGIWIGVAAVGFYSIPILITTAIIGLINSMVHYIFPKMSELNTLGKKRELETLFFKGCRFVGILSFFMFTLIIIFSYKFLTIWVGNEMAQNASSVLILLSIAALINGISVIILNSYLVGIGKLEFFTKYIFLRGGITGIGCVLLLKPLGLNGAGWAMIITTGLDVSIFLYIILKNFSKKSISELIIFYLRLVLISGFIGLIVKFFLVEKINNWFTLCAAGCVYFIGFIILGFVFKIINNDEKQLIKDFVQRIIPAKKH